ncbi:phenylpyruvate tautomerase MIF-related protein [Streptococcus gallolyticus]|uniref:phenylpyruvate tautomerase MIF-related protein n=1 Tax=Streptococcus gallolyticus TaxID=315405 RepID=UPI0008801295|nr:phenylpyruvate tautomerase MIF-related protein [Streptococcus gallolyticus]SDJ96230.1 Macrophage migration inhibitory factor (MIF) [Streptococcus gallolyticus]SDL46042.1 Macrophage migration inhibitory factor (MIF) [Streptococcus gallolyticus]
MPFIMMKTNLNVTKEQECELKNTFGQAISLVPGKSEQVLMVGIEGNHSLYLRGEDTPAAYIEVSIFANQSHLGYQEMTLAMTAAVHQILKIPTNQIYLHYHDIKAWGVSGYYMEDSDNGDSY